MVYAHWKRKKTCTNESESNLVNEIIHLTVLFLPVSASVLCLCAWLKTSNRPHQYQLKGKLLVAHRVQFEHNPEQIRA